jgi:hypothetical protein
MDPVTFYQIGLIRHQEILREAEHYRMQPTSWAVVRLWRRVREHLSRPASLTTGQPTPCGDAVTVNG